MSKDSDPNSPLRVSEEELVAYLDGELDSDSANRVEQALATNPSVGQDLRALEKSWSLLNELPRTEVDEGFTRSTVEMIAVKAEEQLQEEAAEWPRRAKRRNLVAASLLAVAAMAGFYASALLSGRANEQLLNDLTVVENLDQYRYVEDIEFLRELEKQGLFSEDEHER